MAEFDTGMSKARQFVRTLELLEKAIKNLVENGKESHHYDDFIKALNQENPKHAVMNESNTVFQGNVNMNSAAGFIVVLGDGNRNYVRNTKDPEYGIRWKMSERRAKGDANQSYHFHAPESKTYLVTIDIQNNILTLE